MSAAIGMNDAPSAEPPVAVRGLTLFLYWGSLAVGVLLPFMMQVGVEIIRRKTTLADYFDGFYVRLFGPGDGLLALTLLGAAPFAVYAIFALFHLGMAPRHGALIVRRRRLALLLALAATVTMSTWGHYAILTAKGSTAGIGFIFLPFYALFALAAAYVLGRLIARRLKSYAMKPGVP
jgi:hypothetical protein